MSIQSRIQAAIRHAIDHLGKQQVDLAREIGMTKSRISQLYHGDAGGVVAEKIFSIARATHCRAEWIVEGVEPMLNSPDDVLVRLSAYGDSKQYRAVSRALLDELGVNADHIVYISAPDDSMSTTINRGDLVLLDTQSQLLQSGMLYAINTPSGNPIIRRLDQPIFGGWIIRCDNDDKRRYRDEIIKPEDASKIKVVGRIIWRGGSM